MNLATRVFILILIAVGAVGFPFPQWSKVGQAGPGTIFILVVLYCLNLALSARRDRSSGGAGAQPSRSETRQETLQPHALSAEPAPGVVDSSKDDPASTEREQTAHVR